MWWCSATAACGTQNAGTKAAQENAAGSADNGGSAGNAGSAGNLATVGGAGLGGGGGETPPAPGGQAGSGGSTAVAGGGGATASAGQAGNAGEPSSGKSCQGALFCETFENVAPGMPPDPNIWTRTSNDLVVDTTDAALGSKQALHVPAIVNGFKYIREKNSIAAMGKSFYGRVYFRIDRKPLEKPNGLFHWTVLSADELDDYSKGKLIRIGGHIEGDLTNWLRFNFQTHGNPGETGLDDKTMIFGLKQWYCLEFHYSLPDQEARVWVDGTERTALHWQSSVPGYTFPQSISYMSFGWAEAHGIATPWEVWLDEIALDTKQIGCN